MIAPFDYVLGVDGDTVAEPDAVATLLKEIESGPKIGGVSAIFTVDDSKIKGPIASWLVAGQRAQFAAFNIKAMQHHRVIPVLGGQFSLFSVRALEEVAKRENQATPWIMKSEVEDSLLSLQIKSAGYETMLSASARAYVGGMTTLRSLDGQQVKWNSGAVELMRSNPRHPSLTQRWMEHISMFFNGYNRFAFAFLLISSLSISAFEFYDLDSAHRRRDSAESEDRAENPQPQLPRYPVRRAVRTGRTLPVGSHWPFRAIVVEVALRRAKRQLGRSGQGRARPRQRLSGRADHRGPRSCSVPVRPVQAADCRADRRHPAVGVVVAGGADRHPDLHYARVAAAADTRCQGLSR
jgi:GT2 family glycosyltransferase